MGQHDCQLKVTQCHSVMVWCHSDTLTHCHSDIGWLCNQLLPAIDRRLVSAYQDIVFQNQLLKFIDFAIQQKY